MWLPKNERKLLEIYYIARCEGLKKVDSDPTNEKWYSQSELVDIFSDKNYIEKTRMLKTDFHKAVESTYEESNGDHYNHEKTKREMKTTLSTMAAIDAANAALVARNLIKISQHQTQSRIGVSLAIEGYDLGRKYNKKFDRGALWFHEYKDHWIWIILGFIAGILGALVVDVLKTIF